MKTFISIAFASLSMMALFSSCVKNKTTRTYTITRPEYKLKQDVYNDIKTNAATPITSSGKLFIRGNYIFLTEKNKGVHIINNSNPSAPVNESFIPIPGSEDVVVKDNILMADCFIDLLSIDISDPTNIKLVNTAKNVFPERRYVNGYEIDSNYVITEWITKDTTTDVSYYNYYKGNVVSAMEDNGVQPMFNSAGSAGVAGSMARFAIVNNYLYTVSTSVLHVLDVSNSSSPQAKNDLNIGWNIETMYPVKDKLFIGSTTGMFVYSIANPTSPSMLCTFFHANNCDPVIVDDHYAYITLRTGTTCMGINNELNIVDITNIQSPVLTKTYAMTNPHGLSKDGNTLFICDGKDGLKVYDASNVNSLQLLKTISMASTYDVIAFNQRAFVAAEDGLYQYDYSNLNNIQLLSKISTK